MSTVEPGTIISISYGKRFRNFSYIKFVLSCNDDYDCYNISHNEQNTVYMAKNKFGSPDWEIYG